MTMLKQGKSRHSQISAWLREEIEAGRFAADEKLPSENELARKFGVSRVTVRRALQTLENETFIYRSQGLGSFVSDRRSRQSLIRLTDFTEEMTRAGMAASSRVVKFEQESPSERICELLGIEPGSSALRIDRLRLGDGEPFAFDLTWIPFSFGRLLEGHDLQSRTIYRILEQEYEVPIVRGCYQIQAENADSYLASQLRVDEGAALLLIDRRTFTLGEKPVYYQKRYYRSDRVLYELLLERNPGESRDTDELPLRELAPVFRP